MRIQALLFDGFDELDYFGCFEALRMAEYEVAPRSLHRGNIITAAHGTRVVVDQQFAIEEKPDLLFVPGGGWLTRSQQGAWAEAEKGDVLDVVRKCHSAGIILATVCTGSLILGKAGLLKDRPATTNLSAVQELRDFGAKYFDARVVDDGELITASGITASLDLGLWLIERFGSQEAALKVSHRLEFERRGIVFEVQKHASE